MSLLSHVMYPDHMGIMWTQIIIIIIIIGLIKINRIILTKKKLSQPSFSPKLKINA